MVDIEFTEYLPAIAPKLELIETLGKMIVCDVEKREAVAESKRARTRTTVDGINRELQEILRMRAQSLIDNDEFRRHRQLLLERRGTAEAPPQRGTIQVQQIQQRLAEISEPLQHLRVTWEGLAMPVRSRFQRLIFPVGFVAGNIRTAELGLLFKTIGGLSQGDPHVVPLTDDSSNQILHEIMDVWKILKGLPDEEGDLPVAV